MADPPIPPWILRCPWCTWQLVVFGRGSRGADHGSGFEAAMQGEQHAVEAHGRTWHAFLEASR